MKVTESILIVLLYFSDLLPWQGLQVPDLSHRGQCLASQIRWFCHLGTATW